MNKTIEDARATILAATPELPDESLFLDDAIFRTLSQDIVALRALPARDNSAMDGYGIIAADCAGAGEAPVTLVVDGAIRAGDSVDGRAPLQPGHAVRIMTGALVPPGVDAVVMREQTDESGVGDDGTGEVVVKAAVTAGQHIRRRGDDVAEGKVIARAGAVITPARLNLIASAGHVVVRVRRRPVVAILASGDELRELGTPAGDDDVVNSNAHAIAAQVRAAGGTPRLLGIAADTLADHQRHIEQAAFADVLITIGGVSAGTHDFVRPALEAAGARLDFWKLAMRPGKPLAFGQRDHQLVFGLPGNPVSSQVSFELFVRPALRRMVGERDCVRKTVKARVEGEGFKKRKGVTFLARARVRLEDGAFVVTLMGKQGSGQISAMADGNALCVIPPEQEAVEPGALVDVLLLDDALFFGA